MDAYNEHFIEKEEVLVIKFQQLDDEMGKGVEVSERRQALKEALVRLHGARLALPPPPSMFCPADLLGMCFCTPLKSKTKQK